MKVKKAICQPLSLKTHLAGSIVSGSATVTGGDAGGVPVAGDAPASLVRDRGRGSHCQKAGGDKQQLHDGIMLLRRRFKFFVPGDSAHQPPAFIPDGHCSTSTLIMFCRAEQYCNSARSAGASVYVSSKSFVLKKMYVVHYFAGWMKKKHVSALLYIVILFHSQFLTLVTVGS